MSLTCWRTGVLFVTLALSGVVVPQVCADKPKLAIVDFESLNLGADATWGRDLAEFVRQDSALRDAFDLVDGETLRTQFTEGGNRIGGAFDESGCSWLADRVKADLVVAGTLLRYGRTLRLDCTLFEPAQHAMYVCREAFFDDGSAPDEQAANQVSRIIHAAYGGDRRTATVVLVENFAGKSLDTLRWTEGHETLESRVACTQDYRIAVENGLLAIAAEAVSAGGWSSVISARVDSAIDLRDQQDYVIEMVVSGEAPQGQLAVRLAQHPAATDLKSGDFVELFLRSGNEHSPLSLEFAKLRIEISGIRQSATVYSDQQVIPEEVNVDLSALKDHWYLRLAACTGASTGSPRGKVTMRVDDVRVVRIERGIGVRGRVRDVDTHYSLPEVIVRLQGHDGTVRSDPGGYFFIACPPGEWTVETNVPGYMSTELPRVTSSADSVADVPLVRTGAFQIGEIDKVIPLKRQLDDVFLPREISGNSIASDGKRLYFTLSPSDNSQNQGYCSVSFDGTDFRREGTLPIAGALGFDDQRMYLGTAFPGSVYYRLPDGSLTALLDDFSLYGFGDVAFDGTYLWWIGHNRQQNLFLLIVVNPVTGKVVRHIDTRGYELVGIASNGDRLWVCGDCDGGKVYELDKKKAWDEMYLTDRCIRSSFSGEYTALEFAGGHLWGMQFDRQEICRIFLGSDSSPNP